MKRNPRLLALSFLTASALFLLGALWVSAQEAPQVVSSAACVPTLNTLWAAATHACIGKPIGFFCNGGSAPSVEPAGPVSSALAPVGALVEVQAVDAIRTPSVMVADGAVTGGGVVWIRLSDFIQMSGLLLGDVTLRDVTPPDFPAWQSMVVQTNAQAPACGDAPHNVFLAQSPLDQATRVVINGVSLDLKGTMLVQTIDNNTVFAVLAGQLRVLAAGQVQSLWAGQQVSVPYSPGDFATPIGAPGPPQPLDGGALQNLPVALLDRPIFLPQPGYVATEGQVNLRAAPSRDSALLAEVPPGQVMSVLGQNPEGTWYHVQLASGKTGWMFAELLVKNVGAIGTVYEETPLPPQRFGELGLKARVIAPSGVNIRTAPDVSYGVIATLPYGVEVDLMARSPYSPWVKINANGVVGWLALITVETKAVVDALPIDYNVPPPPEPTPIPGSFGNAFPEPKGGQ